MKLEPSLNSFLKYFGTAVLLAGSLSLIGCKEFLDEKPNKKSAIPRTLSDCQQLLDNYAIMNAPYAISGEAAADNYYIRLSFWQVVDKRQHDFYIWTPDAEPEPTHWSQPYKMIFVANEVMDILSINKLEQQDAKTAREIKGAALFYRGYTFCQLAQLFVPQYTEASASQLYGLPLRLSPNLGDVSVRSTVGQTYQQIRSDLQQAIALLPVYNGSKQNRPSKAAAYGAMARTCLLMRDYEKAGLYADSALILNHDLMDYNDYSAAEQVPFLRFNKEVVFQAGSSGIDLLSPYSSLIDDALYQSYAANDLRKGLFFIKTSSNPDGFSFKGSYEGEYNSAPFTGIANDELYLIRAESKARANDAGAAMADLNTLLAKRYDKNSFQPLQAGNADQALELVLEHRRKELVFRGLRWSDLKRLNTESKFQVTISRKLDGVTYNLPPNDPRYTLLIPTEAINKTTMQQNPRN